MSADLGINLTGPYGPTYRAGGLWTQGLTIGRSLQINDFGKGVSDIDTWVHESYHYYQQSTQGWAGQFTRGIYEQWYMQGIRGINPYYTPGTNEYRAYRYELYPILEHLPKH